MQDIASWTIYTLRHDVSRPTWLEERRFDWIPLVKQTLQRIFDGESLILITDRDREWFAHYVIDSVNKSSNRPYLPILNIHSLFPQIDKVHKDDIEIALVDDYFDNVFMRRYFFWYVGRNDTPRAKFVLNREDGFLWLFDTDLQNSFTLQSTDPLIDIKLIQMFRIFNLTIDAAMFGRISLE